jgi:hypothetical protein
MEISKAKDHPFEVLILKKVNPMEQFMKEGQNAEPHVETVISNALFLATNQRNPYNQRIP